MYVRKRGFFQLPTVADRHPLLFFPTSPAFQAYPVILPPPAPRRRDNARFPPPGKKFLKFLSLGLKCKCTYAPSQRGTEGRGKRFLLDIHYFSFKTDRGNLCWKSKSAIQQGHSKVSISNFLHLIETRRYRLPTIDNF